MQKQPSYPTPRRRKAPVFAPIAAVFLVASLFTSCNYAEKAQAKMAEADSLLTAGYFLQAAHTADEAVKLDSNERLVFRRGMIFVEAGVILKEKNKYEEDGMAFLRRGIQDLSRTEHLYEKDANVYFYRAVAKTHTYDKVGACSDIYQAEAFGKRIPRRVWAHAECDEVERLAAESEINSKEGPGLESREAADK